MRSLTLIFIFVCATANAQDPLPADAPIMFQPNPDYVCIPVTQRLNEAKGVTRCLATTEALTAGNVILPTGAFVGIIGGAVVLTAVITGLVVGFAKK